MEHSVDPRLAAAGYQTVVPGMLDVCLTGEKKQEIREASQLQGYRAVNFAAIGSKASSSPPQESVLIV